jgi:hypothetical protein
MYNPYSSIYNNLSQIIINKCYYTNGIINAKDIINYYNNKINLQIDTNIDIIHTTYIKNFIINTYNLTRKTNYLFHYYNSILHLKYFFEKITDKLINKDYDNYSWINVCYSTVINYNMMNEINYNHILLISEYVLEEIVKYTKMYFGTDYKNFNTSKKDSLYKIKNNLMYNDDGNYFIENNIFNCYIINNFNKN